MTSKPTYTIMALPLLFTALIFNSCQSLKTSFGSFNLNQHQEVMIGTVGHLEQGVFSQPRFVSFANALGHHRLAVTVKPDSIGFTSSQHLKFYGASAGSKKISKQKHQVYILSVLDKQGLIEMINDNIDLEALKEMKVVTEIMLKSELISNEISNAEMLYVQFNPKEKAIQLVFWSKGKENSINLNRNDIIGYKSLYLCCTVLKGNPQLKQLTEYSCSGGTYKTLGFKTKEENYERL